MGEISFAKTKYNIDRNRKGVSKRLSHVPLRYTACSVSKRVQNIDRSNQLEPYATRVRFNSYGSIDVPLPINKINEEKFIVDTFFVLSWD